jgi:hypothetical protein
VEQQAARERAEAKGQTDAVLEVLVRKSQEEQAVAARLWQLQQEKAAMEANRMLREKQYAAEREREWEEALQWETELFRWVGVDQMHGCDPFHQPHCHRNFCLLEGLALIH